jgi:hypothetical protein
MTGKRLREITYIPNDNQSPLSCSLSIKSILASLVSRELETSLNSGFIIRDVVVCIRAVPCTPQSFTISITSLMVGTTFPGDADDASTLVEKMVQMLLPNKS